jgi:hypothetical protein
MKKVLIGLVAIVIIIFGLAIYAHNKLGPEEIRELALVQLSKAFPGTKVTIGKLNLSFGLATNINLQDLKIKLSEKKVKIFSVKSVEANIPFWSMLFGLGAVEIKIDSPHINFVEYKNTNNLNMARGEKKVAKPTGESESAPVFFLSGVKVNLILKNLIADYKLIKKPKESIKIARITLKDIGLVDSNNIRIQSEIIFGKNFMETGLNLDQSLLKVTGKIGLGGDKIIPYLNLDWSKGPQFKNKMIDMETSLVGKIWENKVDATFKANLLKGEFKSEIKGDFKKLSAKLFVKSIEVGTEKLNGSGNLKLSGKEFDLPDFKFTLGKAKGRLALKGSKKKKALNTMFDFSLKALNLKHFESFFPKNINVVTGYMNSKINGPISIIKGKPYPKLDFVIDIKNGKIKDFKLEKHLRKILKSAPFLKGLNRRDASYWVTGDFDKLYFKGRLKNKDIHFNNFHMIGIKKKIEITGKGDLIEKGNSKIYAEYNDHKKGISKVIKDYTGKPTLPLKFSGKGYDLKLDQNYSVDIMLKRTIRNPGKKTIEGLKKLFKF